MPARFSITPTEKPPITAPPPVDASASTMTDARNHLPELDRLKGFAIACVVCIHAELYSHTLFFDRIVNRAVPIFIVLFGVTSELWWKRAQAAEADRSPVARWYRTRFAGSFARSHALPSRMASLSSSSTCKIVNGFESFLATIGSGLIRARRFLI